MLREGESKDIGFFKLFATTAPVSLGSIAQECPYYGSTSQSRAGQPSAHPSVSKPAVEVWDTIVKTILQFEVGSAVDI